MPLFEMPMEQLRIYAGRNPRPPDFDTYWDRALAELDATDAQPAFIPRPHLASFAECFDLWFTGVGGAKIHAQYMRPRTGARHAAVLKFHGYTGSSGDWFEKLPWV